MNPSRWLPGVLAVVFSAGVPLAGEVPAAPASATLVVHCYDVGADALSGKPGVLAVERGWQGGREINRVSYDPQAVSLPQLEAWVRAAGTYIGTVPTPAGSGPGKEIKP